MIEAIIVAAGRGSRLRDLTYSQPKPLMMLAGKTLLRRNIEALWRAGIGKITIVTGYRHEAIHNQELSVGEMDLTYLYNPSWETTGIISSLMAAGPDGIGGDVLLIYGDIVYESRLISMCASYLQKLTTGCNLPEVVLPINTAWEKLWRLRMDHILGDAETLVRDKEGDIIEIGQHTADISRIDGQFMGVVGLSRGALGILVKLYRDQLSTGSPTWDTTTLLTRWIDAGQKVRTIEIDGGWLEVDTVEDLVSYQKLAADGRLPEYCKLDV